MTETHEHHDPMLAAWDRQRRNAIAGIEGRTDQDGEADDLLARGDATSIAGVIAKLRSCLWTVPTTRGRNFDPIATSDMPISRFDDVFQHDLARDDYPVECLWTAIRSLERMEASK